jgi:four helix bundle protein
MSRDPEKLRVFAQADELVIGVYDATRRQHGGSCAALQAQLRRAALSAATNIVEGCARRTTREYLQFVNVAIGSAAEARYLLDVARRIESEAAVDHARLIDRYTELIKGLKKLLRSLEHAD